MRAPFFIFLSCALMVGSINGQYLHVSGGTARNQKFVDGIRTLHTVCIDKIKKAQGRGGAHMRQVNEGVDGANIRRLLRGIRVAATTKIGSRPPSCKSKCKGCVPCTPVEVTVPPAQNQSPFAQSTSHTSSFSYHLESPYYSVAWKCRCKGKDYNP